jgi:ubiquitin-protein ligase
MFSRAHILIQQELNDLENHPNISISKLREDSIFELIAFMEGQAKTSWENGIFQIYLKFNENYNNEAPLVFFQTIPYHPNIDIVTGRPSLDFLDDKSKWKSNYTIKHILKSIQKLLAYPMLDRAVNMDAVFMLKGNPTQYENIIKQSVIATQRIIRTLSKRISAGMSNNETNTDSSVNNLNNDKIDDRNNDKLGGKSEYNLKYDVDLSKYFEIDSEVNKTSIISSSYKKFPLFTLQNEKTDLIKNDKVYKKWKNNDNTFKNISYDDYIIMWKGIATSKSDKEDENIYLKNTLLDNPNLLSQHLSISIKDLEEQVYQQLNEHKNVMYGRFGFSNKDTKLEVKFPILNEKTNSLEKPNFTSSEMNLTKARNNFEKSQSKTVHLNEEIFEQEVDELINWTKNIIS